MGILAILHISEKQPSSLASAIPRRKKRVSKRVSPRVMHVIRSETLDKTLGETFRDNKSRRECRIGLYAWLPARLSSGLVFYTGMIMAKITTRVGLLIYTLMLQIAISVWQFLPHCVLKFTIVHSTNYKTVWKSKMWELLPYSVCRIFPHV